MFKRAHKLALLVGVAVLISQCTTDTFFSRWSNRRGSFQNQEVEAAWQKVAGLSPGELTWKNPTPPQRQGWWGL